jgi:hypothetical protein
MASISHVRELSSVRGVIKSRNACMKEDPEMKHLAGIAIVALTSCLPAATGAEPLDSLQSGAIRAVRVNLNPWGPHLGFEMELARDDPRVESLVAVIRGSAPGGGHKCANAGAIRFHMKDGDVIGVGLLPSHQAGLYELRLYDGDAHVATRTVDRAELLSALTALGVPMGDPAFRE